MTSIYDLVYDYIDRFFSGKKLDKDKKKTIHAEFRKLIKAGWTSPELYAGINDWHRKHPDKPTIFVSNLFAAKRPKSRNLLEYGRFYYHNALRNTSPPPLRAIDYDSGEITTISEPYFLEMKASFDVEEVADYYCKQFEIKANKHEKSRIVGTFGYLLKNSDVERIMFMIDVAANECRAEDLPPLKTPLDITDYAKEALSIFHEKKTEAVLSGGNKIVRKQRMS